MKVPYKRLKVGQAFTFFDGGVVYIRVRGGFRPGCGGRLFKCTFQSCPVTVWDGGAA